MSVNGEPMHPADQMTVDHIRQVRLLISAAAKNLQDRRHRHDESKLRSPEVEAFREHSDKLRGLTYGTPEYAENLKLLGPALKHHYEHNSHHPEHYPDGYRGMSLLDLLEMVLDWKAATLRHADGDIRRSVEVNQRRYGYGDDVKRILLNTLSEMKLLD